MVWLALRGLASRRIASILAGLGLLTATLGYVVLTATSATASAQLHGDIASAWATPFDLLVRPEAAITPLERQDGLIRPNYLSSVSGGITMAQLQQIRNISGVDVAAPIAMVGIDAAPGTEPLFDITNYESYKHQSGLNVFEVTRRAVADADLSEFQFPTLYVVVIGDPKPMWLNLRPVTVGGAHISCQYPVFCFGASPDPGAPVTGGLDHPRAVTPSSTMMVIAGIDPQAEGRLTGLDRCVTSGRPLTGSDSARLEMRAGAGPFLSEPVLVSSHSFVDETDFTQVEQAADPNPILNGVSPADLGSWRLMDSTTTSAADRYRAVLASFSGQVGGSTAGIVSIGDVSYQDVASNHLRALAQPSNPRAFPYGSDRLAAETGDVWFRNATLHAALAVASKGKSWNVVGTYDPTCLPSFNSLAGGGLDAYANPEVRLDDGSLLRPDPTLTGYVNSPPTLLTTLDGARLLADPSLFEGQPGQAFIGVIRVKVSGVDSPSAVSEARLARVASDIHEATGLHVDVVKGASPREVQIDLPAGKDGRPAVTVSEGWSTIGVVLTFSRAVTAQNLALFTLVLVGSAGLVGQTAYMSVRRRRRELGVLRAVGWPAWRLATLVELETLVLGFLAGAISVALGLVAAAVFHLQVQPAQWLTALPVAVAIAALSAAGPSFSAAASGTTMTIIVNSGSGRSSHVTRSLLVLGVRDLMSAWRAETALGIATVSLGASLVAILLLIEASFRGQLDTTVLGTYLAARVEPFHAVLAALTLVVATFAAAEILTLAYLERQPHLAVLRAIGWPRLYVLRLLAGQAFSLALTGGILTVVLVAAVGFVLHAPLGSVVVACGGGLAVSLMVGAAALIMPTWLGYRLSPKDHMRAD
jgi:hypothetical protein